MLRLRRTFALTLAVALALPASLALPPRDAGASQVAFRKLEQVVRPETRVFIAQVAKVAKSQTKSQMTVDYEITDPKPLRGAAPAAKTLRYTEVIPLMYGPDGGITGWFSPILDASGAEHGVQNGAWIFFSNSPDGSGELPVFRVEPMSNLDAVKQVLAALPDAAAVKPTTTPPVNSSAPPSTASATAAPAATTSSAPAKKSGCSAGPGEPGALGAASIALLVIASRARRRRG
jgi:hypothetical protein